MALKMGRPRAKSLLCVVKIPRTPARAMPIGLILPVKTGVGSTTTISRRS
jgi:hypothetical protein